MLKLMRKLIGDIVYAPLPGMDIVVLNSYEIAQEVLSKRPSSTAGREVGYLVTTLSVKFSKFIIYNADSQSNF
jgi:hypothetical protein